MVYITLYGHKVVLFGATGGIGKELCREVLALGASLIMAIRNKDKAEALKTSLLKEFENAEISYIIVDLEDIESVKKASEEISSIGADIIIHNSGAYSIPRKKCSTSLDNVFQINFFSPYYITRTLSPYLEKAHGRVIFVGSIAHNYSKTDDMDIDFSKRKKASLVYGNAKRYLMFSAFDLAEKYPKIHFSVTHPGITFTNITAHYPPLIFSIIKHPMKIIFIKPKKATESIIRGIFEKTERNTWIGPRFFNIWGSPSKKRLNFSEKEALSIRKNAESLFDKIR